MKFFFKTSIFIFLGMLLAPDTVYQGILSETHISVSNEIKHAEENYISKYQFEKGYEEAIEFIKDHEGFAKGKAYFDASGIKTIGYGHRIKSGEVFPERISQKEAENLLRKDFDKAVWYAEKDTDVKGYKKIVVAHFIYAKGIGNFRKSNFKKKVLADEPVEEELKKWCYYRGSNGNMVRSEYIYKIRLWEIDMYNREC
ncbi:MAG: lysozyme [Bacteroidales bacterium]|nr:lysozyme [Bacteroidales bacterium]